MTKNGFEVSQANDIREAHDQIDKQPFEIVLSDVRLPGGNGQDLLKTTSSDLASSVTAILISFFDLQC